MCLALCHSPNTYLMPTVCFPQSLSFVFIAAVYYLLIGREHFPPPPRAAFISRPQGLLFLILNSNPMAGARIQMDVIYGQEDQPVCVASVELNHSLRWLHFNIFNLALEGMLFW